MKKAISDVLGECVGVRFSERDDDNHIVLKFMIEDSWEWDEEKFSVSSYWIDDLIDVCNRTKAKLDCQAKKKLYGYEFKDES